MLVANLDVDSGFVNGALGTVTSISFPPTPNVVKAAETSGVIMVQFDHLQARDAQDEQSKRVTTPVGVYTWTLSEGKEEVTATQIPLVPAYALTIHKSQSLTLPSATLELGQCFAPHQAYVALSRLKKRNGLHLVSYRPSSVFCDSRVLVYLDKVYSAS